MILVFTPLNTRTQTSLKSSTSLCMPKAGVTFTFTNRFLLIAVVDFINIVVLLSIWCRLLASPMYLQHN